jgi:hypothetical protein
MTANARGEHDTLNFAGTLCEYLLTYCGDNQAIASEAIKELYDAKGLEKHYKCYSIGLYQSPTKEPFELYRLA